MEAGVTSASKPRGVTDFEEVTECPRTPANAIKRCECGCKKASFGLPGEDVKLARWCADCPTKPDAAVNLEKEAAKAAQPQPPFQPQGDRKCACGKGKAVLALPIQAKLAKWCRECPDRPRNAVPVAGRCECGRRKATLGLPGAGPEGAKYCPHCPNVPEECVELVQAPSKGSSVGSSSVEPQPPFPPQGDLKCACGKRKAVLALPIQAKLAKWCHECPDRPRNAVPVAGRCECGRRKATLGLPGAGPEGAKYCPHCPNVPEECVELVRAPSKGSSVDRYANISPATVEPVQCMCGATTATLALPVQLWLPKWCKDCPGKPRNAINAADRCVCGRRRKTLGLPGQPPKWCQHCPDKPAAALPNSEGVTAV